MRIFLFSVIISLCFFSCTSRHTDEHKSVFNYNEPSGITSLDPAFARSQSNIWAVNQIYNGLVQLNNQLGVEPCIAKSWNISPDGRTYTFNIRTDVFFQDDSLFSAGKGRKVVASDFVFSFSRILDPSVLSPGAWVFNHVSKDGAGFVAVDDSTLKMVLDKPFPPFLGLLSMQYCSVIPKEVVTHYGKEFRLHPLGTGPFRLKLWKDGVKLVLVKNENYFEKLKGEKLPYLDAVAISFIPNRESSFMEFIQGKFDFLSGIDGAYKDRLLTAKGTLQPQYEHKFKMSVSPYLNTEYFGFLLDADGRNPLLKKEVRQAINLGFDREKMISYLRQNIGNAKVDGFVPAGLPSFDVQSGHGYHYDPEKARQLLAKAGYPGGKGMPEFTLGTVASYLDYCTFIQNQLADLGIKMKIEVNQDAVARELVAKSKMKFFRGSWIADYPDAENYLSLFYSNNFSPKGPNTTHFSNKTYDRLYEKALSCPLESERLMLYHSMDSILIEEAPVVVLYYDQSVRLFGNNMEGLESNPMNLLSLKTVKKIKPELKSPL